ncbi:MAG TPA: IS4 family transposase [Parachlamydiaceae bacterium]|nr:IS4 family transposase [Parachlamydiaceae bacterium]
MKTDKIFSKMREVLLSKNFASRHKISQIDFTRNRILTFVNTVSIILNLVRDSIASEIDKFCQKSSLPIFTKSAFSQARHKLTETAFIELNNVLIKNFYQQTKSLGFAELTVLAIDGYNVELPVSKEIKKYFGGASNQSKSILPMSCSSELYDTGSGLTICAANEPYAASERDLAIKHINDFLSMNLRIDNFIILFDRGYPSLFLLVYLISCNIHFLMRCCTLFISEVNNAVSNGEKDQEILLPLKKLTKDERKILMERFPDFNLFQNLSLRICLVELETGEVEILLTSLIDSKKYPHSIFCEFYFNRWGIEGDIGFQKTRMEIGNYSGESVLAVQQEFHATILNKNATTLLALEAKLELDIERQGKTYKHEYEINYSQAFSKMKDRFVMALLDENVDLKIFCMTMKASMRKHTEPIRPGRKFKRQVKYPGKKFHKNNRRVA